MIRKALFQLHWLLGITAGIILAIIGVTGATLSFAGEILELLNDGVVTVTPHATSRLTLPELFTRLEATNPNRRILNIAVFSIPDRAARVTFSAIETSSPANPDPSANAANTSSQRKSSQGTRNEVSYVDPYSGALLGGNELRGQAAFQTIERIHRGQIAGSTGHVLIGTSAIALVIFALSGLYLRWPKTGLLRWQTWFKIHGRLKGRAFLWNLHTVAGTWVFLFYLLSALTGLYFAYDWYRQGFNAAIGASPPNNAKPKSDPSFVGTPNMQRLWVAFEQASDSYQTATFILPSERQPAVEIYYLPDNAPHPWASNRLLLHPITAAVLSHERFAEKRAADRLIGSLFPLHSGAYFGGIGRVVMMMTSLTMPLFAVTGWLMYLRRRRAKNRSAEIIAANGKSEEPLSKLNSA